jgi:hypothetical protein
MVDKNAPHCAKEGGRVSLCLPGLRSNFAMLFIYLGEGGGDVFR